VPTTEEFDLLEEVPEDSLFPHESVMVNIGKLKRVSLNLDIRIFIERFQKSIEILNNNLGKLIKKCEELVEDKFIHNLWMYAIILANYFSPKKTIESFIITDLPEFLKFRHGEMTKHFITTIEVIIFGFLCNNIFNRNGMYW